MAGLAKCKWLGVMMLLPTPANFASPGAPIQPGLRLYVFQVSSFNHLYRVASWSSVASCVKCWIASLTKKPIRFICIAQVNNLRVVLRTCAFISFNFPPKAALIRASNPLASDIPYRLESKKISLCRVLYIQSQKTPRRLSSEKSHIRVRGRQLHPTHQNPE